MKLDIFKIKKFLKVCSINTCLGVINVETSLKNDENCYLWVFLKKCKKLKKKKSD